MRRRIVTLAVLATSLFGIPHAIVIGQYFLHDERAELERVADIAAISAAVDLASGRTPADLPGLADDVTVGL